MFLSLNLSGQQNADDSIYYHAAISNVQEVYFKNIGTQAAWRNGRMNIPYNFSFEKGNPYFNSFKFQNGSLVYEGLTYQEVPLLYDEVNTTLIALGNQGRIELPFSRVDGFTIFGQEFTRINETGKTISTGYYQVLYSGHLTVLKRTKKEIREDLVSGTGIVRSIDEKNLYYIRKANVYYAVNGKKDLLKILKDKNQEIQHYIKKQKFKWKKDAERLIVEVAAYYDQLTK